MQQNCANKLFTVAYRSEVYRVYSANTGDNLSSEKVGLCWHHHSFPLVVALNVELNLRPKKHFDFVASTLGSLPRAGNTETTIMSVCALNH